MSRQDWIAVAGLIVNLVFVFPVLIGALRWLFEVRSRISNLEKEHGEFRKWIEKCELAMDRRDQGSAQLSERVAVLLERLDQNTDRLDRLTRRSGGAEGK